MKKGCLLFSLLLLLWSIPALGSEPPVTRGEFLVLIWESQGCVPFDKTAHPFADLPEDAQAQAVAWAWDQGLVKGVGNFLFAPDRPITRQECAVLLRRLDLRLGFDPFLPSGAALCNDNEGIDAWAGDDLYWACITGRMPWQNDRLAPQGLVDAQIAKGLFFSS